jgi:hypothetical protein
VPPARLNHWSPRAVIRFALVWSSQSRRHAAIALSDGADGAARSSPIGVWPATRRSLPLAPSARARPIHRSFSRCRHSTVAFAGTPTSSKSCTARHGTRPRSAATSVVLPAALDPNTQKSIPRT